VCIIVIIYSQFPSGFYFRNWYFASLLFLSSFTFLIARFVSQLSGPCDSTAIDNDWTIHIHSHSTVGAYERGMFYCYLCFIYLLFIYLFFLWLTL
jgi:hypothetical protein